MEKDRNQEKHYKNIIRQNTNNYIDFCKKTYSHSYKKEYNAPAIYFITDGKYFKIGKAKKPYQRLANLQTGNPRKLTLLMVIDPSLYGELNGHDIESEMQELFDIVDYIHNKDFVSNIRGEWYKLTPFYILFIEYKRTEIINPKLWSKVYLKNLVSSK